MHSAMEECGLQLSSCELCFPFYSCLWRKSPSGNTENISSMGPGQWIHFEHCVFLFLSLYIDDIDINKDINQLLNINIYTHTPNPLMLNPFFVLDPILGFPSLIPKNCISSRYWLGAKSLSTVKGLQISVSLVWFW